MTPYEIQSYWERGEYRDVEELGVLLAEIDRLRAENARLKEIPDKDLDGLIEHFVMSGYPLNPEDMKNEMRQHFGPMWAAYARLREAAGLMLKWDWVASADDDDGMISAFRALRKALEEKA